MKTNTQKSNYSKFVLTLTDPDDGSSTRIEGITRINPLSTVIRPENARDDPFQIAGNVSVGGQEPMTLSAWCAGCKNQ